jgi:hypothetical protein
MTETKFTVFFKDARSGSADAYVSCASLPTLESVIRWTAGNGEIPVAWTDDRVGPFSDLDECCAVAIAAGRTLVLINGEWVPRGVPVEDKPQQEDAGKVWRPHPAVCAPALPTTERTRPALDWADSKRVDRWEGYTVRASADFDEMTGGNMEAAHSHPLQRIAQEGDQLHGSAFLRKVA